MMLEARQVGVVLGGKVLLDNISLTLLPGQVTALLGPNGAGKSTLLKVLTGDVTPTYGAVYLDGRPLEGWSLVERARRRAVVPQESCYQECAQKCARFSSCPDVCPDVSC
jgi:iron complex transport system ATP-binding protein